jgi:hypothetical protein
MATVTRTFLDDLDGSIGDVETRPDHAQISLDETNFEIDLSAANATRMPGEAARPRCVANGTRVTPQKTRQAARIGKPANRHNANTRYTTTLAGSSRTRVSRRSALANTSSTVSRSISRVSTPRPITSVNRPARQCQYRSLPQ